MLALFPLFVVVSVFVSQWSTAHSYETGEVSLITSTNEKDVLQSKAVWLLAYGSVDENGREGILKVLEELALKVSKYEINVGYVDCTDHTTKNLCTTAKLVSALDVRLFFDEPVLNPYTDKVYRTPVAFSGIPSDLKALETFIAKNYLPKNLHKLPAKSLTDQYFSEQKKSNVVFLSEKENYGILTKSIAFKFLGDFEFNHVHASSSSLKGVASKYTSSELPALFVVRGEAAEVVKFSGNVNERLEVIDFLKGLVINSDEDITDTSLIAPEALTEVSLSFDKEYAIVVVELNSTHEFPAWKRISSLCSGNIEAIELRCGKWLQNNMQSNSPATGGHLGEMLCKLFVAMGPFTTIIPHGEPSRKKLKLSTSLDKLSTFKPSDGALLEKKIGNTLPEIVNVIPDGGAQEAALQELLRENLQSKVLSVFVFSDKGSVPNVLKNVALSTKNTAQITFFSHSTMELANSFGGRKLPHVVALFPQVKSDGGDANQVGFQPFVFDTGVFGSLSHQSLTKFILTVTSRPDYVHQNSQNAAASNNAGPITVHDITTSEQWSSVCGINFRGICVLQLYSKQLTENNDEEDVLTPIRSNLGAVGSALQFIRLDGRCQSGLAQTLGVSLDGLPAIVAFSPSKNKFANFRGSFNKDSVKSFIESVLSGKTPIFSLQSGDNVFFSDTCSEDSTAEPLVDDVSAEDSSDFLAEIMKEEKEKAEALANAVEEERKAALEEKKRLKEEESKKKTSKKKKTTKKKKATDEL